MSAPLMMAADDGRGWGLRMVADRMEKDPAGADADDPCLLLSLTMVTNCVAHQVQKAQTKRWLKQEYRVALAAALEQRIEDVCETKVAASDGV
jgi:hypothetical protein